MAQSAVDLGGLFGAALQALTDNRQQVNSLDGYNGNHGDNMVENLRLITEALQGQPGQAPSAALANASRRLQAQGRGGASPYYAQGLEQAAQNLQGRSDLDLGDVASLLQTVLGSVPGQGSAPQPPARQAGPADLMEQLLGAATGQPQPSPQASVLQDLLGMAGQQPAGAQAASGGDAGDLMEKLLPAGLAFLQAKQQGADTAAAAQQALMSALLSGTVNPAQAATPRAAAGGLIAQSILKAFLNR